MQKESENAFCQIEQSVWDDTVNLLIGYILFIILIVVLGGYLFYWMGDIII